MINVNRKEFQPNVKSLAMECIDRLRPTVYLDSKHFAGRRFNDTGHVVMVLESMFSQVEFELVPLAAVQAALLEAASADEWYEREKQYGSEVEYTHENDGEYDGADYAC